MSDDDFLPPDYETPDSGGAYLKLSKAPTTTFRILAKPVMGSVGWKNKKPIRKRMGEDFAPGEVTMDADNRVSHFWAMPVWNYGKNRVQILEVTQSTVQSAIEKLAKNAKWGSPLHYDICVVKTGEGLDTEYSVMPEPKSELPPEAAELWAHASETFSLDALFTGGDPFAAAPAAPAAPTSHPSQRKFFALLGSAIKDGLYTEDATKASPEGKDARRKILAELMGGPVDPAQMNEGEWQIAAAKLDSVVKANAIPF